VKAEHLKLLEDGVATIGLRLDAEQRALLARHVDVLLKWNKSVNLTAITDPVEVVEKHLLDSLALAPLVPKGTLLDAGTGGGFPGIPIRIARPDVEVLLVDSSQKKIAFLKNFIAETRITGVQAIDGVAAVTFVGTPGRTYTVQAADSLLNPQWSSIGSVNVPLSLGFARFSDALTSSNRFYRLRFP